jgi:hypothetical protein
LLALFGAASTPQNVVGGRASAVFYQPWATHSRLIKQGYWGRARFARWPRFRSVAETVKFEVVTAEACMTAENV